MYRDQFMERKSQNLEFSQELSANKSEECLERRSHNMFTMSRPACASGGDIANNTDTAVCNSKTSSYQNIMENQFEDGDQTEDSQRSTNNQSDVSNASEGKQSFSAIKRKNSVNNAKYCEVGSKLKAELSKYKKELKDYNNTTKDLEEKYLKINFELNEMQQKHDRFVANRKSTSNDTYSDSSSSTGSEYSLKRKYTQVFNRENELNLMRKKRNKIPPQAATDFALRLANQVAPQKRHTKHKRENKENEAPLARDSCTYHRRTQSAGLKDIYKVLKNVLDTNQKPQPAGKGIDLDELQTTISNLLNEQAHFRTIIQQQQSCLHDYHSRCTKAHHIMQTQQIEIEKLNSNNQLLETEITSGIDQLRLKIDSKLRDVAHLPQMMRDEQSKHDKVSKDNSILNERLRTLQNEAAQLKLKMEELGRRKTTTINRLKAAERDLKIFKNYNTALKHEKRKLSDELQKLKEQFDTVQNSSKRSIARQREQNEKQRRDLQKRVFELELKLSRSQNSTTSLIQERDSLIAELQTQLNTLVHNFEVSQKHIRVLRRHIYSMSGGNVRSSNRLLNEAL